VLGILAARDNGKGVTGLAPKATIKVSPANTDQGFDVAFAIGVATGALKKGDVILLEQQTPVCGGVCGVDQVGLRGRWSSSSPPSTPSRRRPRRGSSSSRRPATVRSTSTDRPARAASTGRCAIRGAIVVGAGSASTGERLFFSSFGSRVDVQGWGEQVATTGGGDAFDGGSRRKEYTGQFSGTSSASPIVTGAVAMIQGALKGKRLAVATPKEIRKALVKTGQPRAGSAEIGPLPDTGKALTRLLKARQKEKAKPVAAAPAAAEVLAAAQ
jgi:serine protease